MLKIPDAGSMTLIKQCVKNAHYRFRTRGIERTKPKILGYVPHDLGAFTQGLAYHDGVLYESTGLETASSIRKINPASGAVLARTALPGYWAEGVAVMNDELVQLTWKHGCAITYDLATLTPRGRFLYDGEGWGLTSEGDQFIMSDGTATLTFRDPSFRACRTLPVRLNNKPLGRLNDLAAVHESIFANVYYDDNIYSISPVTGDVLRILNCAELRALARPTHKEAVLNGITYDYDRHCLLVTGKYWRYLFAIDPF